MPDVCVYVSVIMSTGSSRPDAPGRRLRARAAHRRDGRARAGRERGRRRQRRARSVPASRPLVVVPEPTNAGFAGGVARGIAAASGASSSCSTTTPSPTRRSSTAVWRRSRPAGRVAASPRPRVLEGRFAPVAPGAARSEDLVAADGPAGAGPRPAGETLVNGTGVVLDRSGNGRDRDWLRPVDDAPEPRPAVRVLRRRRVPAPRRRRRGRRVRRVPLHVLRGPRPRLASPPGGVPDRRGPGCGGRAPARGEFGQRLAAGAVPEHAQPARRYGS